MKNERSIWILFYKFFPQYMTPSPLKRWWRHLWKSSYTNLSISYSFLCIDQQLFQPSWFRKQYCCALMHASKNYQSSLKWTIYKATLQSPAFRSFKLWNAKFWQTIRVQRTLVYPTHFLASTSGCTFKYCICALSSHTKSV